MTQITVWTLSLFLVLTTMSCEDSAIVDAFTAKSMTCRSLSSNRGRTIRWSLYNPYPVVEEPVVEEDSSTELATSEDSSTEEEEKPEESSTSTIEPNENGDKNEDSDIDAMAKEVTTTEESSGDESDEEDLMQKIKDSGVAGVISYAAWELAFWTVSVPVCVLGYKEVTGHWPDFSDKDDLSKLGAEAFAFVNFARFAVPLRIGLALGTTPWIQENIVDVFLLDKEGKDDEGKETVDVIEEEAVEPDKDIKNEGGRLRILSRLRNLKNRVFKRKSRDEQDDKE